MRKLIISIIIIILVIEFLSTISFAQSKRTIYLNKNYQKTAKRKAIFVREVEKINEKFVVKDYYKSTLAIEKELLCDVVSPELLWNGETKFFYENGKLKQEGYYTLGKQSGLHKFWYDTGSQKMEIFYKANEERFYVSYWTSVGKKTLVEGSGTMPAFDGSRNFNSIRDSLPVATFEIDPITSDSIFSFVEVQPYYSGGLEGLYNHIEQILKYPNEKRKSNTEGRVFVQFIIDKNGDVKKPQVSKGIGIDFDKEAIRVISSLNNWSPGRVNGKPVSVTVMIPVFFKLRDKLKP